MVERFIAEIRSRMDTRLWRSLIKRKMATLVAFAHHFEATAQDDALDILSIVLSELFSKAKRKNHKKRLRTIKDLDSDAATLINACKVVLEQSY